jgi:gamma-glutamylcyclotransferase (GGCT)/AIG2-like uncharacterized protein YtfP
MSRNKLIAVYGTLRRGCGNYNYLLTQADYKGEFLSEPIYSLYSLGGFPGLKNGGTTSVKMEVFSVNDEEASNVDALEGYTEGMDNPYFYDKQSIETPWGTAGVYIYVRPADGLRLIESGDWLEGTKKVVIDGLVE